MQAPWSNKISIFEQNNYYRFNEFEKKKLKLRHEICFGWVESWIWCIVCVFYMKVKIVIGIMARDVQGK